MAEFTWSFDAPTGTFKNHALSAKIREAAIAQTKFLQFVEPEPGYGRKAGDTVTISRIRNLAEPTSGQFGERDRVPIDTFAVSTKSITVSFWGRGVEYTDMTELLAHFDLRDKIQRKLMAQQKLVLDTGAATAFKAALIKAVPSSLSALTITTNGAFGGTSAVNSSVAHMKIIRDYMMDTIHVPGWRGGEDYYALCSTKFCRGIRNDPEFIESAKYTSRDYFVNGEIGKVENIHVVEVNHTNALANNKGTGGILGEAVFFGDDAVSLAVVMDPEMRAAIPGNFGLQNAVAWIGLLQFGLIWDTANDGEARVVHFGSL